MFAIAGYVQADLLRKLAGRRQHQGANVVRSHSAAAGKPLQQGQGETGGLAGTGLRRGHDVPAGEHSGDRLDLDRSGRGVAAFVYSSKKRSGESKGSK